jgi:hypothetical protein
MGRLEAELQALLQEEARRRAGQGPGEGKD